MRGALQFLMRGALQFLMRGALLFLMQGALQFLMRGALQFLMRGALQFLMRGALQFNSDIQVWVCHHAISLNGVSEDVFTGLYKLEDPIHFTKYFNFILVNYYEGGRIIFIFRSFSPFYFLLIECHYTLSISYIVLTCYVYYYIPPEGRRWIIGVVFGYLGNSSFVLSSSDPWGTVGPSYS